MIVVLTYIQVVYRAILYDTAGTKS